MSSHFLTDKSLTLEARFGGFGDTGRRIFAEPGVSPTFAPDRGFCLDHIDVSLIIDPESPVVRSRTALVVRPLPSGLGDVVFDLDHLSVSEVTDGAGLPLRWTHSDGRLAVHGLPATGGTVVVSASGTPQRGLYFVGATLAEPDRGPQVWSQCQDEDAHYFFPCLDHPSVKSPMTMRVSAPKGYTVIGNGTLRSREGDTWVWDQPEPIPAYLATVVVARLASVEERWRGRSVRYLAPEGVTEDVLRRVFGRTPQMMEFFSERFGVVYPWPRYDQVVVYDFIFGGMENVAATTLTDLVLTDDRAALDYSADDLIAHELAHQWFGDLVTCQDWSQAWLNEGWATYSEHLWAAHAQGQEEADYDLFRQLEDYLEEDGSRYRRAIVDYRFREPIDLFDRHLYEKAALVLHTLRHTLGDEAFFTAARLYLQRHSFGTVHTRDFQRAFEEATGRNLDGFFHQWIYSAGHPTLDVEISHTADLLTVCVRQTQTGDGVAQAFQFPLRVVVVRDGQQTLMNLPIRERERTWSLLCPTRPERVEVDAGFCALAELKLRAPVGLLVASLRADSAVGRVRAARALAAEGSPAAIEALLGALTEDPFWGVRAEVARSLGKLGVCRAREGLLAALTDDHPKARRAVVEALGEIRHPDAIEAVARVAMGDPSVHVEGEALRALGRLRAPQAIDVCTAALDRDSWGEVLRARALEGLAATRDPQVLGTLIEWSKEHRPTRARAAAAAGLGKIAEENGCARREAADQLASLALEAPFRVRMAAIAALGLAREPRAEATLRQIHEAQGDGRLRRHAYEAMTRLAGSADNSLTAVRRDLDGLRDENRALRDRLARLEDLNPR